MLARQFQSLINHYGALCLALSGLFFAPVSATLAGQKAPNQMVDDTWITIEGTVESVRADNFTLSYGDNSIIVEMDDGDRDADAYNLIRGDKVSVTGVVDHDLFERRTIEASSVYVENIGTTFFASAVDEEGNNEDMLIFSAVTPITVSRATVTGVVTQVNGDEFVVSTGFREIRIEVDEMAYNPLDDEGYQKIEVGDRVKVVGNIDDDLFEGRELVADSVISLS